MKRLSDIERQDLAERFEEIHRKFKQMNGLLYKYHQVGGINESSFNNTAYAKNDLTLDGMISIPGSKDFTPEANTPLLNKIYSPDTSKNHKFLNEKVSTILNEFS